MDKGFPDRIKQYKIKWYIGPGNYGSFFTKKVTYLAISVGNEEQGTFLLFVSESFEVLTVLECEDEQDAFDAVELPDEVTWIRIDQSEQQKKYNRMYAWRSLLNIWNSIKVETFLIIIVLALVSEWFPRYGDYVLLFQMLRSVFLFGSFCGFLKLVYMGCKSCGWERKFDFLITRGFFLVLAWICIYLGKGIVSVGIDSFTGTRVIYLTSASYYREDVSKGLDIDYITGEYEGQVYHLAVTGCKHSLLYEIEETHPVVKVIFYEKSKSVVKLEIVDDIEK